MHETTCRITASLTLLAAIAAAQAPPAITPAPEPAFVEPHGITGHVMLAGGGALDAAVHREFVQLAGGNRARLVLVPTASAAADDAAEREELVRTWRGRLGEPGVITVLHTRDRAVAEEEGFCQPLRDATAVWFGGGDQQRIADAYLGTRFEREVMAVLQRGGVVGGTSAGAAIGSRTMIAGGRERVALATGFDLVPGAIVDQHFSQRSRLPRLQQALAAVPGHFGIGIDEGTAIIASGRRLRVTGKGKALVVLPASEHLPERQVGLAAGDSIDLPTWHRAARHRRLGPWPLVDARSPEVRSGALVIVGGGSLPDDIVDRFVQLAGGSRAHIVFVSSAEATPVERTPAVLAQWERRGVSRISRLDNRHPGEWNDECTRLLAAATGVWFGGGRQWRLCDAYDGTAAIAAFHGVLERGGVIGGSSAGATIQGDHLVRGNPLGNTDMWCEGYDRGFGFLRGVAIDQHFLARNRMADLTALVERFPQVLGIGIDEGTAAIVAGTRLEVLGKSKVVLVRKRADTPILPLVLERGQQVNLLTLAPQ